MATGYNEAGAEELLCIDPGEDFLPTAMCASVVQGDEAPSLTFGVADFSIEVWLKWAQGNDSPGADVTCWLGAMAVNGAGNALSDYGAALRVSPDVFTMRAFFDDALGGVGVNVTTGVVGMDWKHLVLNYDRAGPAELEVFIDSTSVGTVAINANAIAACPVWPYVSVELDARAANMPNNDDADWFGAIVSRVWQGPMAVHGRLLTDAEINDSYREHRVQNIAGVTEILWDPRNIEGHTGWEVREDYICSLDRGLLHLPFGAPEGVYGTVVLPDSSGNGNDFSLPVAETYGNANTATDTLGNGGRARCCFIADPWWR
ncbi:MAG TPA: hypothetical protein VMW58_10840 [Anaerolineae bacterium]|nr:hypothetical protein [Anaerolineae bacterium]